MRRSLFLHHYLPAMACNYLLIGSVFEYFFIHGVNSPISDQPNNKRFITDKTKVTLKSYIAAAIILGMQFTVYLFLSPMTYGTPAMSAEEATRHKVLKTWDIQFGKYVKFISTFFFINSFFDISQSCLKRERELMMMYIIFSFAIVSANQIKFFF